MSYTTPSRRQSFNRRSSGYSPVTPRSSHEFEHGSPAHNFDGGGDDNGLGNLADELGEIWDDEDEDGVDGDFGEDLDAPQDEYAEIGTAIAHDGSAGLDTAVNVNGVRDSGVAMHSSPSTHHGLSPDAAAARARKHNRQRSLYDGSDYGSDTDFDNEGISPAMESRMAAVESLARRGMEENGSTSDQVIKRVTEQLRDLGSQIAIENGATRHVNIETLLPLIESTLELLPHSSTEPIVSLAHLTMSTRELLQHLANVSDTLHMSRQTTTNATRRLRTSKEQLHEWKRENEKTEEGRTYIERGDWDRRLKEREAKRACANVVEGFEDICGMWRKRLCEGLGVASA
ncbi:hypothetical protein DE146DRAFT_608753 [Phaeosphaeria sp. MPI-PUGE-AT-0046c]|nr:hypothetical protein DE146DRAFT_608753 [Phaeosphaeria sp. MPI-PUGE-AT-0046c]